MKNLVLYPSNVALLATLAAMLWQQSTAVVTSSSSAAVTAVATRSDGERSASTGNGTYHTFTCFFSANCIAGNCSEGTTGVMCEQCVRAGQQLGNSTSAATTTYARLGSSCIKCEKFPWAAISFATVIVLIILVVARKGFSQSVATKIKLLFDALQLVLLTFRFPVFWPTYSLTYVSYLSFAYFTPQMIFPTCLFKHLATDYYVNWVGACCPLVMAFLVTWIADRIMRRKQVTAMAGSDDMGAAWMGRRTVLRRGFVLLAFIYYAPVSSLVLRSYACESNLGTANLWYYEGTVKPNDTNRWLYNYGVSCNSDVFQAVTFFSTFILIFYSVLGPVVLLFFAIRLRKWKLLSKKAPLHGAAYESYRANWCFMEPVVLLRKLIMVLVADIYPLTPVLQEIASICLSTIYLLLIILGGPFRQGRWSIAGRTISIHNIFEVFSTVLIIGIQVVAIVITYGDTSGRATGGALDFLLLSSLALIIVVWLMMFVGQLWAETSDGEADAADLREGEVDDQPIGSIINQAAGLLRSSKVTDSTADNSNAKAVALAEL